MAQSLTGQETPGLAGMCLCAAGPLWSIRELSTKVNRRLLHPGHWPPARLHLLPSTALPPALNPAEHLHTPTTVWGLLLQAAPLTSACGTTSMGTAWEQRGKQHPSLCSPQAALKDFHTRQQLRFTSGLWQCVSPSLGWRHGFATRLLET